MNNWYSVLVLVAGLVFAPFVAASEYDEMTFGQGSVLVICTPPDGAELTKEQFDGAFPEWITYLQTQANEGVITRAHYLGALSSGIFIVVAGEDKDVAMTNAQEIMGNLNDTFQKVTGLEGADTCDFREIGPVAILPQ